jgi:type IV secretory pathway VirB2 component (pilin)
MFRISIDGLLYWRDSPLMTQTPTAIGGALDWVQGVLLGSIATSVAILGVAAVGFLMLSGRIDPRRAATVVTGCFVIFGASAIARGITESTSRWSSPPAAALAEIPPVPPPPPVQALPAQDPYAGAALPQ